MGEMTNLIERDESTRLDREEALAQLAGEEASGTDEWRTFVDGIERGLRLMLESWRPKERGECWREAYRRGARIVDITLDWIELVHGVPRDTLEERR